MKTKLSTFEKFTLFLNILLAIVAILIFASCSGAKQVKKEETKSDSTATIALKEITKEAEAIKQIAKVDSSSVKSKSEQTNTLTGKLVFAPIDPKQESSITDSNGKTTKFKNLKGSIENEQKSVNTKYDETVKKLSQTELEITSLKQDIKSLNAKIQLVKRARANEIKKEQFNWGMFVLSFWWLWLLLILIAYMGYCYFRDINPLRFIKLIK